MRRGQQSALLSRRNTDQWRHGGILNLIRPYIGYAGIDEYESIFRSNYHSLQTSLQKRFSAESLITVNYNWSKNLTDVPYDPNYTVLQDSRNLKAEYSNSRFDQRHVFNASFVHQESFFTQQHGLTGRLLGSWQLSGIVSAESGHLSPSISDGQDPGGLGLDTGTTGNIVFPDQVGDPNQGAAHTIPQWFNTAASLPAQPIRHFPEMRRRTPSLDRDARTGTYR